MANILLLDESDVAGRAMQGILARGNHRCFIVTKPEEAWRALRDGVVFDIVFLELKLAGNGGILFLQRLRDDWFLKLIPVVIYSSETDARQVKKALSLKVQNYLIKPYNDDLLHAEIAKAQRYAWRNLYFEDAKTFGALMGLTGEQLTSMRREVMTGYDQAAQTFPAWRRDRQNEEVFGRITKLAGDAEAAGIWAGVDFLRELHSQAALANWETFTYCAEHLDFASRLIFSHLNPSYIPDCMKDAARELEAREAAERQRWEKADVDKGGPLVDAETFGRKVSELAGCPVVENVAASFQMSADGRPSGLVQVMDLCATDPGLCLQILMAANHLEREDMMPVEDVRSGATQLGDIKLNAIAKALPIVAERHLNAAPLTASSFWTFQLGVSRATQFVCNYLDLSYLTTAAETAGLVHDCGKLLLLKTYPFALAAISRYAREKKVPLRVAEQRYLGTTLREVAASFVAAGRLPAQFVNVIRWVDAPDEATADAELVAVVALARHICVQGQVGHAGEIAAQLGPVHASPAWGVLLPQLFPSFEVKKFEAQANAFCVSLKQELSGRARREVLVA